MRTLWRDRVLAPYRTGRSITINGKTIQLAAVERVKISACDEPIERIIENLKAAGTALLLLQ